MVGADRSERIAVSATVTSVFGDASVAFPAPGTDISASTISAR